MQMSHALYLVCISGGRGRKDEERGAKGATGGSSRALADATNTGDRTIEQIYQKKTQLEHILLRPDTYSKLLTAWSIVYVPEHAWRHRNVLMGHHAGCSRVDRDCNPGHVGA